jgi:hypothetical protein
MASVQYKGAAGVTVPASGRCSEDTFISEAKERRRKLIAAINATRSERAEEAEAALAKYLDEIYPETKLSQQTMSRISWRGIELFSHASIAERQEGKGLNP